MEINELMYPSKMTIDKLTSDLNLVGADEFTQDWECEVANVSQLPKYIDYYKNSKLNANEKTTLMRIILEAYNDYVSLVNDVDMYANDIKFILTEDYFIHQYTLKYWSCDDEPLEDCFAITAFIREIDKE